ncbi:MAG: IS1634 family transposase [Thermodesulfobacteriota bacterium]|nr:IS1634 family transposase [Thermodesulfobacteriota bacterium]
MYIRRTKTRNTSTGEGYFTHRLVCSQRIDGKVRQRTLLNLGRHFEVAQDLWPALCSRLDQLLHGEESLFPSELPAHVERKVQHMLAQLVVREAEVSNPQTTDGTDKTTPSRMDSIGSGIGAEVAPRAGIQAQGDIQTVDVDSLRMLQPRSVGVEQLGLWAMQRLDFAPFLENLGLNGPQRSAMIGLIIGRMAAPASEYATHRWLRESSALGELLDVDYEQMSLMQLYRASDLLMKHRSKIEKHLFDQVTSLFGFSCTVTLYDLTNTYFETSSDNNPKAKHGRSKEKRSDCPLLTLGLVLDGSGFVRRSECFAGNVFEATTLKTMLNDLDAKAGALVVMDRGIATEDNITWLRDNGYRYLVVSRERQRYFDSEDAITINNAANEKVHLQKVYSEETNDEGNSTEVRLYCHSEQRAKKEEAITNRFAERFEAALEKLAQGLSRPRTTKQIDKVWERIGRLKEKSRGASQHYTIELIADADKNNAIGLKWQRKPIDDSMQTHPGVYCLRSNETEWDAEKMWRTYTMLTDLEAVFRSLKSELGLRPVYHQKEERCDGHIFITVLAYQFVQFIRYQLRQQQNHSSWRSLRTTLTNQCRITATFKRTDGRTLHVRKATQAEPKQLEIYQALNVNSAPGGTRKMIV